MTKPTVQRITELPDLPARPDDGHKGTFGKVLIVAGSRGMSGAACLAGLGALRGGAGLVYVAAPVGIVSIVAVGEPSYLTIPLAEDEQGRIAAEARPTLSGAMTGMSSIAVGPGWGQSDDLQELAAWLYTTVEVPLIVDADALNLLAKQPELFSKAATPRILTPHPGEFARLIDSNTSDVEQNREKLAVEFAAKHNVTLLLKGHRTLITDGRRLAENRTGNSGMATGGSGDVLTGLIAALLAQAMPPFEAAQLAAHLHGLAGDIAAKELSRPALIASDLPNYLPQAWQTL